MQDNFLLEMFLKLLSGLPLTIELSVLSLLGGGIVALLLNLLRTTRVGDVIARIYVFLFRGTPLLIQIYLVYYGLGNIGFIRHSFLWPLLREPYWCALLALVLCDGAYTAEILRGGLKAVPRGAVEAARVCGMSRLTALRRVILPLAFRQALPAYGTEIISMIKSTSLASTVTLMEVTGIANAEVSATYRALEIFGLAAVIYLVLSLIVTQAILLTERRLSPYQTGART